MGDFRKADTSVYAIFLEMIEKVFPELSGYSFGLIFRDKVKKSKGGVILAEICQPTKLMSFFARNDDGNPFDFLLIADEMVWACAQGLDRVRLIRHELRHIKMNDKGKAMMVDHDFADFHVEVELNVDNPAWASKLVEVALAGYSQMKEGGRDPRIDRKDSEDLAPVDKSPQRQVQLEAAIDHGANKEEEAIAAVKTSKSATVTSPTSLTEALAKKRGLVKEEALETA